MQNFLVACGNHRRVLHLSLETIRWRDQKGKNDQMQYARWAPVSVTKKGFATPEGGFCTLRSADSRTERGCLGVLCGFHCQEEQAVMEETQS